MPAAAFGFQTAHFLWLQIERVTIPIDGLSASLEGFRIVHLSDLHVAPYTSAELIAEVVEITNRMTPDLIVLTGDYVTHRADAVLEVRPALSRLKAVHGVYAVLGNHDGWADPAFIRTSLESANIRVLENSGTCIGDEPGWLYLVQFLAVAHFLGQDAWPVHLLPFGIEGVPPDLRAFDTVFSMGVFYHRRSPIDHLLELRGCLKPGGELVLETLVLEGELGSVLVPEGRYAKMRNLWFIPSLPTLESWLKRCGFRDVRVCDVTPTTTAEQRSTPWMRFESLKDFLDPRDASLTVEGYPAPLRAVVVAHIDR